MFVSASMLSFYPARRRLEALTQGTSHLESRFVGSWENIPCSMQPWTCFMSRWSGMPSVRRCTGVRRSERSAASWSPTRAMMAMFNWLERSGDGGGPPWSAMMLTLPTPHRKICVIEWIISYAMSWQ